MRNSDLQVRQEQIDGLSFGNVAAAEAFAYREADKSVSVNVGAVIGTEAEVYTYWYDPASTATVDHVKYQVLSVGNATGRLILNGNAAGVLAEHKADLADPHKTIERINDYVTISGSTSTPTPYTRTLVDSSGGALTVTLPAVLPGDVRWYSFTLNDNSNHCSLTVAGAACLIGGFATLCLSTEKSHVTIRADGIDCYKIIEDTRSYDRVIEVTGNQTLASGFESGGIYYGEPADASAIVVTISNFDAAHIGDYAKFVKKSGENATYRIVSVDQTFDETINENSKGFTLSVAPGGYIVSQDSRPTASNIRITFYPTDNVSIFQPAYEGVLETETQPEEVLTSSAITSTDSANPTSLGFWINDNKALIGDLAETPIIASATIKLAASYNRSAKIRFRYYEFDFGTGTLNPAPLSTTSYSSDIDQSAVYSEIPVSGTLPANSWAANDASSEKLLVIELQAFKSLSGGDNPVLEFVSGGENASSTYLTAPLANVNHNTLGGVVHAALGVPDGHVDSTYPLQIPSLTNVERDAIAAPVNGMTIYNEDLGVYQGYFAGSWGATLFSGVEIFQITSPAPTYTINLNHGMQIFTDTGSFTFNTGNRSATIRKIVEVLFQPVGADITPTFNPSWKWSGLKPTVIGDGTDGVLILRNSGDGEQDILATYDAPGDGT